MKKVLIIALILVIVPTVIFAKSFSFGTGATATNGYTINSIINKESIDFSSSKIDNTFGECYIIPYIWGDNDIFRRYLC